MDDDVEIFVESAKSLVDWRGYVTANPLASLGVAFALGFVVVPKKKRVVEASASQLRDLLDGQKVVVAPSANVKPKKSMFGLLVSTVATVALRQTAASFGEHFASAIAARSIQPADKSDRTSEIQHKF
jgi:hypothetical protein